MHRRKRNNPIIPIPSIVITLNYSYWISKAIIISKIFICTPLKKTICLSRIIKEIRILITRWKRRLGGWEGRLESATTSEGSISMF